MYKFLQNSTTCVNLLAKIGLIFLLISGNHYHLAGQVIGVWGVSVTLHVVLCLCMAGNKYRMSYRDRLSKLKTANLILHLEAIRRMWIGFIVGVIIEIVGMSYLMSTFLSVGSAVIIAAIVGMVMSSATGYVLNLNRFDTYSTINHRRLV